MIAIIAILASMLLPALSKAREKARGIQCMNNNRQIAQYYLLYAEDNHEILPGPDHSYRIPGGSPEYHWPRYLAKEYSRTKSDVAANMAKLWVCPSFPRQYYSQITVGTSYGINSIMPNGWVSDNPASWAYVPKARPITLMNFASRGALVIENYGNGTSSITLDPTKSLWTHFSAPAFNHSNDSCSITFLDLHAEMRPPNKVPSHRYFGSYGVSNRANTFFGRGNTPHRHTSSSYTVIGF